MQARACRRGRAGEGVQARKQEREREQEREGGRAEGAAAKRARGCGWGSITHRWSRPVMVWAGVIGGYVTPVPRSLVYRHEGTAKGRRRGRQ